jgi:hypothetical protein
MISTYEKSCCVLNISSDNENDISSKTLNRQYRKMSLLYHPDKNLKNSSDKFHEINNAYQYLGKYLGYMDDDNYSDIDIEEEIHWTVNYKNKIVEFFDGTILNQIISMNEEEIIKFLKTVDKKKIIYLYKILYINRIKFNVPNSLLLLLSNVLRETN